MSPSLISGSGEDGCLDSWAGVEEWGHMGCYNPVEDVSTYKGCERRQPTAPCCQLAEAALHIERLSCSAHWASWAPQRQRASESFMFSLQLASICMTHIFWCTVRRFRSKTNISAEKKCCSFALNRSFVSPTERSLPRQPESDWCFHSLIEMQETYSQKKRSAHSLATSPRYTSAHRPSQPRQHEVQWVSVGLKIEIASAALIYFISVGTHLHTWELMARISMNVKAGCCAVMHLGCFVLPWKQGSCQLQQTDS